VLQDAGAIHECEEHGWAQDRADPHARERALELARLDPPGGLSSEAVAEVRDVLDSIGDTCLQVSPVKLNGTTVTAFHYRVWHLGQSPVGLHGLGRTRPGISNEMVAGHPSPFSTSI
jgi:hypothetical protein